MGSTASHTMDASENPMHNPWYHCKKGDLHAFCTALSSEQYGGAAKATDLVEFLHIAVEKKHAPILKFLLEMDELRAQLDDVVTDCDTGMSELEKFKRSASGFSYMSALQKAVHQWSDFDGGKSEAVVTLLLSHGADVNKMTPRASFPLGVAVQDKNSEKLSRLLLQHGANPNVRTRDGDTTLLVALKAENLELARMLLSYGAEPNTKSLKSNIEEYELLPVFLGAWFDGDFGMTILTMLLESGADFNVQCATGKTALHIASSYGNLGAVAWLLTKGVNVNAVDVNGDTPLAVNECSDATNVRIVRMLLDAGASVNVYGTTPPLVKVVNQYQYHENLDVIKLMMERGADVHGRTTGKEGLSALDVAKKLDHATLIKLFTQHNASRQKKRKSDEFVVANPRVLRPRRAIKYV